VPTIPLTDKLGLKTDIQFDDKSDAATFGLQALQSKTDEFVSLATKPLDQSSFHSAIFGGTFKSPAMPLNETLSLLIKSGATADFALYRSSDETLFGSGGASPEVVIASNQAWVKAALDTSVSVQIAAAMPSGLGVSGKVLQTASIATYTRIESSNGSFPTVKEAVGAALSNLRVVRTAADIHGQPPNTVYEWAVSGTFTIDGTYSYPLAVNGYGLGKVALPLNKNLQIASAVDISITGEVAVTGEFRGRCYRISDSQVQLGLYKKKETDFTVSFDAMAGVTATAGSSPKDLIGAVFGLLPGANLEVAQIPDDDRKPMHDALQNAMSQGFTIALNNACTASLADEAAVLYEIDFSEDVAATDAAINSALRGNWTLISKLKAAKELRNVLTKTRESGTNTTLNLLGVYDYASLQDFVRKCSILHNLEDGEITVTDKETAQRIAISSKPFRADPEKLRKVLDEAFLATVAYTAADSGTGFKTRVQATQSLLQYKARADYPTVRKSLLLGVALDLITPADLDRISKQREFKYFRVVAKTTFDGENALRLFFSDVNARTPHNEQELKSLGRQVLASLLDRSSGVDDARWRALTDNTIWSQMEDQKFPQGGSYSDWYDIAFWAHSVATVAPRLKAILEAAAAQKAGDPTKDPKFMAERDALAKAIAEVTRNTKAAFEKGWPVAVMFALSGRNAPVSFEAKWDGKTQFAKEANKMMTA
jgi:hypothetical protein